MVSKHKDITSSFIFYSLLAVLAFMLFSAFYTDFNTAIKNQFIIGFFSLFFFTISFMHAWRNSGRKFAIIFFIVMVLYSFSAEYTGTHLGLFYSHNEKPLLFEGDTYYYAEFMPLHIFKVPLPLILMWPFIIYSSFYLGSLLSQMIFARNKSNKRFILPSSIFLASLIAMLWDISFDPLATKLGFWTWVGGGSAFKWINGGIPIGNFTSWFLITMFSLLIFAGIMKLIGEKIVVKKEKNGMLLSLFLFIFIWTFSIPQGEYVFLIIAVITQAVAWWIVFKSKKVIL